ncbi:MAG: endonuclease MutS2, partial [Chloroflexi bacterium]
HMGNIVRILNLADSRSLVILDELGAGTDPVEGAALARAILSHLRERSITTLVATHISELKAYAYASPGVENASVEFDPETLAPTYVLRIGLPGYSNALAIASRLGLNPEIIREARELLPPQKLEADALLAQIREAQRQAQKAREETQKALEKARAWEEELRRKAAEWEKERHRLLEEARQKAEEELEELRREIRRNRLRLSQLSAPHELKEIAQEVEKLEERLPPPPPPPRPITGPIEVGDQVWVEGLNSVGEVVALADGDAVVVVDNWRVRVPLHRLEKRESAPAPEPVLPVETPVSLPKAKPPPVELHLRGKRVEEALILLDDYLDKAFLAGLDKVRIIHGKGTGALRRAIREHLAEHPLVASFYPAPLYEGGEGVTIVKLNR